MNNLLRGGLRLATKRFNVVRSIASHNLPLIRSYGIRQGTNGFNAIRRYGTKVSGYRLTRENQIWATVAILGSSSILYYDYRRKHRINPESVEISKEAVKIEGVEALKITTPAPVTNENTPKVESPIQEEPKETTANDNVLKVEPINENTPKEAINKEAAPTTSTNDETKKVEATNEKELKETTTNEITPKVEATNEEEPKSIINEDVSKESTNKEAPKSSINEDVPKESTNKNIASSSTIEIPTYSAPYVLIGAGTASYAAMKAIHDKDPLAKILLIGDENDAPYMRPPLSKELWLSNQSVGDDLIFKDWNGKERGLYYKSIDKYVSPAEFEAAPNGSFGLITGVKVTHIDTNNRTITLANGHTAAYKKLLIATGGQPKNLPVFEDATNEIKNKVTLFRKISNFLSLEAINKTVKSITVIGGGFLGSEMAVALAKRAATTGLEVNQVFPEDGNMALVLPHYLSQWATKRVQEEGVNVQPNCIIDKVSITEDDRLELIFNDGHTLVTDHVVVAVGQEPNVELALDAGLEIDEKQGGIVVNRELLACSDVYVAGDVASFYDPFLGRRRMAHHDHAIVSGRLAGENMADPDCRKSYHHQAMFWSDLGPRVGYEAVGIVDSALETVSVWAKESVQDTVLADREEGKPFTDDIKPIETATSIIDNEQTTNTTPATNNNEEMKSTTMNDDKEDSEASLMEKDGDNVINPVMPVKDELDETEKYKKGVVFYMKDKKVVGVLLWNIFGRVPTARSLIAENRTITDLNDLARVINVHN